jgi:hypothetical protein
MPWMQTNATGQRLSFLIDYASGQWSMSELCERYRVSRPTGYKWSADIEKRVKGLVKARVAWLSTRTPARLES